MYFTMCYIMYYTMYKTYLGPISFEAKEVRGPIPDKAYTVPMKTSLAMTNLKYQLCDGTVFLLIRVSDAVRWLILWGIFTTFCVDFLQQFVCETFKDLRAWPEDWRRVGWHHPKFVGNYAFKLFVRARNRLDAYWSSGFMMIGWCQCLWWCL